MVAPRGSLRSAQKHEGHGVARPSDRFVEIPGPRRSRLRAGRWWIRLRRRRTVLSVAADSRDQQDMNEKSTDASVHGKYLPLPLGQ